MMKYENRLRRSPVEESLGGSLGNQAILRSGREAGYLVDVLFDKVRELPYGLGPSSGVFSDHSPCRRFRGRIDGPLDVRSAFQGNLCD